MEYATANVKTEYDAQPHTCAPGEINRLNARLDRLVGNMTNLASDLTAHADRLHGGIPNGVQTGEKPRPVRSGAFGNMEDLIDLLEDRFEALTAAAFRNTTMA